MKTSKEQAEELALHLAGYLTVELKELHQSEVPAIAEQIVKALKETIPLEQLLEVVKAASKTRSATEEWKD